MNQSLEVYFKGLSTRDLNSMFNVNQLKDLTVMSKDEKNLKEKEHINKKE